MPELSLSVDVAAPPERVWAAATDWERQGEWIPATRVRGTALGGRGVGAGLEAFTGVGTFGVLDTMVVTTWDPPRRCVVRHTGRVVRGSAAFEVEPRDGGSRFVWTEWIVPPLGLAGLAAFPLVRPVLGWFVRRSLERFAPWAAAYPGR